MAEMTVKMNLTLADVASPGFKAFIALVDSLGPKVTGLNNRLTTLDKTFEKVGQQAQKTTTAIDGVGSAATNVERALQSASGIANIFETAMRNMTQILTAASTAANNLTTAYTTLGNAAQTAGAQAGGAAGGFGAVNNQLNALNTTVNTVSRSIQGMMELWAASKLKAGLGSTVKEAADYQSVMTRVTALNLSDPENKQIEQRSDALSKKLPYISRNEALKSYAGAIAGVGHNAPDFIAATLEPALKTAMIAQQRGDKSSIEDVVRNLYGLVEARGQTSDPEAAIKTFDMVQKALSATQSKVTIRDMETVFRQIKSGFGFELGDEGMAKIIEVANQLKSSGVGGGAGGGMGVATAGTSITQALKTTMMGVVNKETARKLMVMGLLDGSDISPSGESSLDVNVGPKGFKHLQEIVQDPIGGFNKYFAPAFLKFTQDNPDAYYKGGDKNNVADQDRAVTKLTNEIFGGKGGVNVVQLLTQAINPRAYGRIEAGAHTMMTSKGIDQSEVDIMKNYDANVKAAKASLETLEQTIGTTLLPVLTKFMDAMATLLRMLDNLATKNPAVTTLAAISAGILTITLAISGFLKVFAVWEIFNGYLVATAAASGAAATGVTGFFTALQVGLARVLPLLLVFTAGFAIGSWLADLKVGGTAISDWLGSWVGSLVTKMQNGWARMKAILGLITAAQRDAIIKENNASHAAGSDAPNTQTDDERRRTVKGQITQGPLATGKEDMASYQRKLRDEAAAKLGNMAYKPYNPDDKKQFYDPDAEAMATMAKTSASDLTAELKQLDQAYKANKMSATAYYDAKKKAIEGYMGNEIYFLQMEQGFIDNPVKGKSNDAKSKALDAKINDVQNKRDTALGQIELDRERALLDVKNTILDVDRQSDAVEGQRHNAEIKRLTELISKRKALLQANPEASVTTADGRTITAQDALNRLPGIESAGKASIDYTTARAKLTVQLDAYKQQEKQIANEVTAGTKAQYEAENEIYLLRKQEGALLDEFIQKYQVIAAESKDPKLIKDVQDMVTTSKLQLTSLSPEALKVKNILESGMTNFFATTANGVKGLRAAFDSFFRSILNGITQIAAQQVSQAISRSLFGGAGSNSTGFGGGLIGGAVEWLGGKLAGPMAAFNATDIGITGSYAGDLAAGISALASGTPEVPQDMIAQIHKGEAIVPASMASGLRDGTMSLGGGGGQTILNATFNVPSYVDQRSQAQIAAQTAQYLDRFRRRNT